MYVCIFITFKTTGFKKGEYEVTKWMRWVLQDFERCSLITNKMADYSSEKAIYKNP